MKKLNKLALIVAAAGLATVVNAQDIQNWRNASGEVWKNSAGQCWRSGTWTPATAAPGCDGAIAPPAAAPAPAPVARPAPAPAPAPARAREPSYAERAPSTSPHYAQTQPRQSVSPYTGHVTSVTPISTQAKETGLGMIGGAVVGGLLGNQVGRGNGRTLATVGGALAGGYGGHVAENYYSRDTQYRVNVRMDNGTNRSFTYKAAPGFQPGDRVHIEDGSLVAG